MKPITNIDLLNNIVAETTELAEHTDISFVNALLDKRTKIESLIIYATATNHAWAISYHKKRKRILDIILRKELETKYWPSDIFLGSFGEIEVEA